MVGIFTEYCGPDIWIYKGEGPPRNAVDAICKKHDDMYEELLQLGLPAYSAFSQADQSFMNELEELRKSGASIDQQLVAQTALLWFKAKKQVRKEITRDAIEQARKAAQEKTKGMSFFNLPWY